MSRRTLRSPITLAAVVLCIATMIAGVPTASAVDTDAVAIADRAAERALGPQARGPDFLESGAAARTGTIIVNSGEVSIGTGLDVQLPVGENSDHAVVVDGDAALAGSQDTTLVVDAVSSDTVRISSVLETPEADTRIPYEFDLPEGAVLEKQDDGSVDVVVSLADGIDAVTASIEQPWAVDANGAPVATEYQIFGATLMQVVHTTSDTAFPVVADPTVVNKWWGIVVRFNRSETASVGLGGAVCNQVVSKIPHPAATVLGAYCGVLATVAAAAYAQPNKCPRVNVGWIGGVLNSVTPWIGTC
jgi:hypothetical protein